MTESDPTLLERWTTRRDADAFRELVVRYSGLVHATARRVLGRSEDADDVTQECFLKLSQTAGAKLDSLPSWLHRVTTNCAISSLRSETRRRRREADHAPHSEENSTDWQAIEALVDESIAGLTDEERLPIVEHYLEGRTQESIARDLGVTRKAVSYRIQKGIEKIRRDLRRRGVDAPTGLLLARLPDLATQTATKIPPSVEASLQKIAISGSALRRGAAASGARSTASLSTLRVAAMLTLAVATVGAAGWFLSRAHDEKRAAEHPALANAAEGDSSDTMSENSEEESLAQENELALNADSAGEPAPSEEPPAEDKETSTATAWTGRVVDGDGNPLAGARVLLSRHFELGDRTHMELYGHRTLDAGHWSVARTQEVLCDEDGRFRFENVEPFGSAEICAHAEGFVSARKGYGFQKAADFQVDEDLILVLEAGKDVAGRVLDPKGEPIADGVVSIYHSYNDEGYSAGGGFDLTDPEGRFRLGAGEKTTRFTVRVCSERLGQEFFTEVDVDQAPLTLQFAPTSSVHGSIEWSDGSPALGHVVHVDAEIPEARPLQMYSGIRRRLGHSAAVDDQGRFEIEGLHPGFRYAIWVAAARTEDPVEGERVRAPKALSPRWENVIVAEAGTRHEWSHTLRRPLRIRGIVTTERLGTPASRVGVKIYRDGKALHELQTRTKEDGRYEIFVNSGPGRYRLAAGPDGQPGGVSDSIAETWGKDIELVEGDDLEVDLHLPEPIVLPLRVVDAAGNPHEETIRARVAFQLPNKRRYGHSTTYRLDEDGRTEIRLYHAVLYVRIEAHRWPIGPEVRTEDLQPESGERVDEIVLRLPPTFDLSGRLVDADGQALAKVGLTVEAKYADGRKQRLSGRTDEDGRFTLEKSLGVGEVVLEISARGQSGQWKSEKLKTEDDEARDIGEIRISAD